jgi:lipid-A-disaccharide synthase
MTFGGPGDDPRVPRIFIVAGEDSGDHLGAPLMRALKADFGRVEFAGVGGPEMAAEGLQSLLPIKELAVIGFSALVRHLPRLLGSIRQVANAAIAADPDVLVIIDSPEFTHRIARQVRAARPDIPIIDYVSPSVWAWRPWRARAMRRYIDHVLALLPFEPALHAKLGGPPCTYVGHPLVEQVRSLRPSPDEERRRQANPPVVLVLPGSRGGELRRLLPVFGDAIALLQQRCGAMDLVLPTLPHHAAHVEVATAGWAVRPRIVVDRADKQAAFRTARAALAKSGTVTLELALAGVPMVTAYKVSLPEEVVARIALNVPSVILANLVLDENVVPELLQRACTPQGLADTLAPLLAESPQRQRQVAAFARLDEIMQIGKAEPSRRAAEIVTGLIASRGRMARQLETNDRTRGTR